MANANSAKGNPASKRMSNPNYKAKRARNKSKNEQLRAKNQHPKQLRQKANEERARINKALNHNHKKKWCDDMAENASVIFAAWRGVNAE